MHEKRSHWCIGREERKRSVALGRPKDLFQVSSSSQFHRSGDGLGSGPAKGISQAREGGGRKIEKEREADVCVCRRVIACVGFKAAFAR